VFEGLILKVGGRRWQIRAKKIMIMIWEYKSVMKESFPVECEVSWEKSSRKVTSVHVGGIITRMMHRLADLSLGLLWGTVRLFRVHWFMSSEYRTSIDFNRGWTNKHWNWALSLLSALLAIQKQFLLLDNVPYMWLFTFLWIRCSFYETVLPETDLFGAW